jgi:beta-glucosidase
VQPAPDRWDEYALDRYIEIMRGMHERNMTPLITLHHFTDPLWLTELGGWQNEKVVEYFAAYAGRVVEALREYVNLWVTLNEPNGLALQGYFMGIWPPEVKDLGATLQVLTNQVRAHAAAYHAIHRVQPQARVGIALYYRSLVPARPWLPLDRWATAVASSVFNDFFLRALSSGDLRLLTWRRRVPEAKNTQDYIGLDYYTRDYVAFDLRKPAELFMRRFYREDAELSDTGFSANEPEGLFEVLRHLLRYKLPIIVTENGVEDADDHLRPRFLIQHLHQLWRAVNFNYPVEGYFHWSLVDNFEWERGWTQRFGLWELDEETQARRKRPSADLYTEICRENGLSSEMVARYAPELFESMFPN